MLGQDFNDAVAELTATQSDVMSPILTAFESEKERSSSSLVESKDNEIAKALEVIASDPNYRILRRVPEVFEKRISTHTQTYTAAIIDLETTGLHPKTDAIIELGLLKFSFDDDGILEVLDTYNGFNETSLLISEEITNITGISGADVAGKKIDWEKIEALVQGCDFIICHNSSFDRNFLELQTPDAIQALFKSKPFACTMQDINWSARGHKKRNLEDLNLKLGFFYDGHRALNDCWATFNLLCSNAGALAELRSNMQKTEFILWAVGSTYGKTDLLKQRKYTYFKGSENIKKCWQTRLESDVGVIDEVAFLERTVYCRKGAGIDHPVAQVTAHTRYSYRSQEPNMKAYEVLLTYEARMKAELNKPLEGMVTSSSSMRLVRLG